MRAISIAAVAFLSVAPVLTPVSAHADGGAVAAGVAGGLLGGMLLGGALAQPRPYYEPAPVYEYAEPVYVVPRPRCYWTRGEPYWDDWAGVWRRPRLRVCD